MGPSLLHNDAIQQHEYTKMAAQFSHNDAKRLHEQNGDDATFTQ